MWTKILLVVFVLAAALALVIYFQPSEYRVERSTVISAPVDAVFARVNDFHRWEAWSPWAKLDPAMKVAYSGPSEGAGAVYEWTGNSDVGSGRMTILESRPGDAVRIQLDFIEPFASSAITEFRLAQNGAGTKVTWAMSGTNNFLSKAFCLFMGGMDKAIGPDFEKGLRQLKSVSESAGS